MSNLLPLMEGRMWIGKVDPCMNGGRDALGRKLKVSVEDVDLMLERTQSYFVFKQGTNFIESISFQ